jgi:hypothetical protein
MAGTQAEAGERESIKAPADGPVVLDDYEDGWPGYEEPVFVYH